MFSLIIMLVYIVSVCLHLKTVRLDYPDVSWDHVASLHLHDISQSEFSCRDFHFCSVSSNMGFVRGVLLVQRRSPQAVFLDLLQTEAEAADSDPDRHIGRVLQLVRTVLLQGLRHLMMMRIW